MDLKNKLRQEVLAKRSALSTAYRVELSRKICDRLIGLKEFQDASVMHFYIPIRDEVDIRYAMRDAFSSGKTVVVPVVDKEKKTLFLSRLENYDEELAYSVYGLLEPKPEYYRLIPLKEVDMMILPGIAFDMRGHRLGYGAGYYDKLLSDEKERPFTIAPAFEVQIVDFIPASNHDVRVNKIITEERVIICQQE